MPPPKKEPMQRGWLCGAGSHIDRGRGGGAEEASSGSMMQTAWEWACQWPGALSQHRDGTRGRVHGIHRQAGGRGHLASKIKPGLYHQKRAGAAQEEKRCCETGDMEILGARWSCLHPPWKVSRTQTVTQQTLLLPLLKPASCPSLPPVPHEGKGGTGDKSAQTLVSHIIPRNGLGTPQRHPEQQGKTLKGKGNKRQGSFHCDHTTGEKNTFFLFFAKIV